MIFKVGDVVQLDYSKWTDSDVINNHGKLVTIIEVHDNGIDQPRYYRTKNDKGKLQEINICWLKPANNIIKKKKLEGLREKVSNR